MKKLLYITNAIDGSGGLERVLSVKTHMLSEVYNYEIHIITLNQSSQDNLFFKFSKNIVQHNLKVYGSPFKYLFLYFRSIKKVINEISPSLIIVCDDGLKGFFLPKILGKKIPIIYERHVSKLIEITAKRSLFRSLLVRMKFIIMDALAKNFTKFIVLTEGNLNEWNIKNTLVISNPLPFFPEKTSGLLSKKVIAVGKQTFQKSYERLIEIWSLIPKNNEDWKLNVYGKKDLENQLDNLVEKFGLQNCIFFHEPEKNIENKYLESSIFVLSSRFEGFGMVIIEAMSCGIPVVSFDCPYGPSDIITNGEDGFIIPNGNLKMFAEKLSLLMNDDELRNKMGKAARENSKKYLPENIVKQWDELFKSLIK